MLCPPLTQRGWRVKVIPSPASLAGQRRAGTPLPAQKPVSPFLAYPIL